MTKERELDIIVYGATGFTGQLVCEHLNNTYGVNGDYKWAMAGRSHEKLTKVRDELGFDASLPLIVADSGLGSVDPFSHSVCCCYLVRSGYLSLRH